MDWQHSVAGVGGFIRIGQREYRLRPLTLGDLAELKAYIAAQHTSPLVEPEHGLDCADPRRQPELLRITLREARDKRGVTAAELETYLDTFDGVAHLFWLMARNACPGLDSLDAAKQCLGDGDQRRLVELQARLDQATGFISDVAPLGKLSRPGTSDDDDGPQWFDVYRGLSVAYGWTPEEINRLTLFQVAMYLNHELSGRGTIRMKLSDANVRRA